MRLIKKNDILIVLIVFLCCGGIGYYYESTLAKKTAQAEIYLGSQKIETILLNANTERIFSIEGQEQVVFRLSKDGSICFASSDCPDKVCIRAGKLKQIGESAVCLPNKLIIKIVPIEEQMDIDLDLIAG